MTFKRVKKRPKRRTRGRSPYRKNIAFQHYDTNCHAQKKNDSLEQFHAELLELASKADCVDKEDEWVRDMFTAHMLNKKISEEILAKTRSLKEEYEYAIRREKGNEHNRIMKSFSQGHSHASGNIKKNRNLFVSYTSEKTNSRKRGAGDEETPRISKKNTKGNENHHNFLTKGQTTSSVLNAKTNFRQKNYKVARPTIKLAPNAADREQQHEQQGDNIDPVVFAEFISANGCETIDDHYSVLAKNEFFKEKNVAPFEEDLKRHWVMIVYCFVCNHCYSIQ